MLCLQPSRYEWVSSDPGYTHQGCRSSIHCWTTCPRMMISAWPSTEQRTDADTRFASGLPFLMRGSASMVGSADTSGRTTMRSA